MNSKNQCKNALGFMKNVVWWGGIVPLLTVLCTDGHKTGKIPLVQMELFMLGKMTDGNGTVVRVGGRAKLKTGWHTYWLNPGDAGLAPVFKSVFTEDQVDNVKLSVPHRIVEGETVSIGYEDSMLFTFDVNLNNDAIKKLTVQGNFLVCNNECIPVKCTTSVVIEEGTSSAQDDLGMARMFTELNFARNNTSCKVTYSTTDVSVNITVYCPDSAFSVSQIEDFIPLPQGVFDLSAKPLCEQVGETLVVKLKRAPIPLALPDTVEGVLVTKKSTAVWLKAVSERTDAK